MAKVVGAQNQLGVPCSFSNTA